LKIDKFKSINLDIGCGENKQEGFLGMDSRKLKGVDIVHNIEKLPLPLPANSVGKVVMCHFWEHIKPCNVMDFMNDLHRICKDKAQIFISAPYGMEFRYIQDPTHCNPSNEATFHYFDKKHPLWGVYKSKVFHLEYFEIIPVGGSRDFNAILKVCKKCKCS